ncbi:hypothetical protein Tco_1214751 [Tanacetum coccineum]
MDNALQSVGGAKELVIRRKTVELGLQVGSSKVLAKVGAIAYRLELPQELNRVHHMFHVSNLKKCHVDEPLVVLLDGLHIDDKLHFIEENIEIMDREVKWLNPSCIPNCQGSLELSARS